MIENLKNEIELLEAYVDDRLSECDKDTKKHISKYLNNAIWSLKKEVADEENRIHNSNRERTVEIEGVTYNLPCCMNFGVSKSGKWFVHKEIPYLMERWKDDDGFHFNCICAVKEGNKYVQINARFLGGDRFGDRIFAEASYYKSEYDSFKYLNKGIRYKGKHKEYIDVMIDYLRNNYEGLENFMKER